VSSFPPVGRIAKSRFLLGKSRAFIRFTARASSAQDPPARSPLHLSIARCNSGAHVRGDPDNIRARRLAAPSSSRMVGHTGRPRSGSPESRPDRVDLRSAADSPFAKEALSLVWGTAWSLNGRNPSKWPCPMRTVTTPWGDCPSKIRSVAKPSGTSRPRRHVNLTSAVQRDQACARPFLRWG